MNNFKELKVWSKAIHLVTSIYKATKGFPDTERFGLISQLQRAAVSIPSTIAEGAGRNGKGEFWHFLGIALGSSYEVETQLIIANQLNLIESETSTTLLIELNEIQKMISGLQKTLK